MIYKVTEKDSNTIARMAINMWKNHTVKELEKEFRNILENKDSAIFF